MFAGGKRKSTRAVVLVVAVASVPVASAKRYPTRETHAIDGTEATVNESTEGALRRLSVLVGEWTTESTHPAVPGTVIHGQATFEWLEGERFLIWRERADHPDFPDSIAIIGDTDGLQTHSFDSGGVYRVVETRISDEAWEYFMPREQPSDTAFADGTPGFSGRFVGTFEDGGNTIVGRVQLSYDDENWQDDLQTTYHRMSARRD
jgi:hypothetical protein